MAAVNVKWDSDGDDKDEFEKVEGISPRHGSRPQAAKAVQEQPGDDPAEVPESISPASTTDDEDLLQTNEHSELQHEREPQTERDGSHGHASAITRLLVEAVLVAAVVGLGLWAWSLNADNDNLRQQVSKLNNDPQSIIQKQSNELVSKVGALIQLPTDETPTIANVSDAEAAKKESAFFTNAQNGDRVLMYAKAGQAILYRPSTNKVVLVAPLTFNGNANTTNTQANTSANTTKAVTNNGTTGTTSSVKR